MNFLKKNVTVATVLILTTFIFSSCGNDDELPQTPETTFVSLPGDAVGDYEGELVYQSAPTAVPVNNEDGTATITSTGDKVYKITFSDGVPAITGLKFISSDGKYTSSGSGGSSEGVTINGSSLSVGANENGSSWSFSGSK